MLPFFLACNSDDNDFNLEDTKWVCEADFNTQYYWLESLEFKSKFDCIWTVVTKVYGPGYGFGPDDNEPNNNLGDGFSCTEYHLTFSVKNSEINLSNNGDNVKAVIDLKSNTITIGDKIFKKQ